MRVLALDIGASSGRGIVGWLEENRLRCREVHRFVNAPLDAGGTLYWDFAGLLGQVHITLNAAGPVDSIAFDTWGVDFGLLNSEQRLLQNPLHYRDSRFFGAAVKYAPCMPPEHLFARTGNQIMDINTLFQLKIWQEKQPELFEKAETLLFMPDLLGFALCGQKTCEASISSTSQMLDPATGQWSQPVLDAFGIPQKLLLPPVPPGRVLGQTAAGLPVITVAGHDTQCAVAALPLVDDAPAAFLSCGTWGLLGTELPAPILQPQGPFSNELGAQGRIHYLHNGTGLWLVQECRRQWKRQGKAYSFSQLEAMAQAAPPSSARIDPDWEELARPGDIPGKIQAFCQSQGLPVPQGPGDIVRCIYQSLADQYAKILTQMEQNTRQHFARLHLLGGGAQSPLLAQCLADSCRIPVLAGPAEATALGNILLQLMALGALPDLAAGRRLIAQSQPPKTYLPL